MVGGCSRILPPAGYGTVCRGKCASSKRRLHTLTDWRWQRCGDDVTNPPDRALRPMMVRYRYCRRCRRNRRRCRRNRRRWGWASGPWRDRGRARRGRFRWWSWLSAYRRSWRADGVAWIFSLIFVECTAPAPWLETFTGIRLRF